MCDGHNFTTYSRSRSRPLGQLAWREVVDLEVVVECDQVASMVYRESGEFCQCSAEEW